jgi:uncharacterized protein (TIGR01777 family)
MDVIVTGASGLIGSALRPALAAAGHRMIALVRRPVRSADEVMWDPPTGRLDRASIEGAGAAVHLAGVGIAEKRWTDEQKRALRDSRVQGTGLLARAIAELSRPPAVLVSASAVGYYGDRGDEILDELSPPGDGFLPDLCVAWESATAPAEHAGTRVVHIRTGIVLSHEGGALRKQLPLFKLGLGGRFGSGRQWQSWITIDDVLRAIQHLFTAGVVGPVNLTAPEPVRNAEFTKTLGTVLGRPTLVPVPKFGPSLVLGRELAGTLLYSSLRVVPKQLEASGFEFAHPELEGALRHVLDKPIAA